MLPNLHIFGIQGSGKDTQAALLASHFGLRLISSGVLLRERMTGSDETAEAISGFLQAGSLVPDAILTDILLTELKSLNQGIVGAGLIRTLPQLEWFTATASDLGFESPFGIVLEVPEATALERAFSRNRSDDTELALQQRFALYRQETLPVIEKLRAKHRLISVSGVGTVEHISETLITQLATALPSLYASH